ncbi:unnamed protein product [Camellia sinensis]
MAMESISTSSTDSNTSTVKGVLTHGGQYVRYNVYGNLFEVSHKYVPPIRPIGRGAYGIVCAAVNSETHEEIAIKKIGNAFDNQIDAKRTLREIKLLCHMDHENILAIKDIIRPPKKQVFNDVYIVSELMDTDLHQIIRSNQPLTDDHCQYFMYQLLRGLKYVHSANVLHRDLKPSNLFLNANCDLKIADFGLARTTSETDFMTEYVVTRWYRAPELLLNCSEYTAAIDVWSVGCIHGEIATREPLFPGRDYAEQLRLITESSPNDTCLGFLRSDNARRYVKQLPRYPKQQFSARFPNMSPLAIDLLEKMLVFDPTKRITDSGEWIAGYSLQPSRHCHILSNDVAVIDILDDRKCIGIISIVSVGAIISGHPEYPFHGSTEKWEANLRSKKNSIPVEIKCEMAGKIEAASQPSSRRYKELRSTIRFKLAQMSYCCLECLCIQDASITNSSKICYACAVSSAAHSRVLKVVQNTRFSGINIAPIQ